MQSRTTSLALDRKTRLQVPARAVAVQPAGERVHNWREVVLGFDLGAATGEAGRCIQCPAAPCTKACPLHNDIPGALWLLEQGDPIGAAHVFRATSNMPEICGRVCPQEKLCEGSCVVGRNGKAKPVQIGKMEQFCADLQRRQEGLPTSFGANGGGAVAVVGAGPAGLSAAEELARAGHPVTLLDAWPRPGGVLRYGIPTFKLDKAVVDAKVAQLEAMGVTFVAASRFGRDVSIDQLLEQGHRAVFLAYGASVGNQLAVPGEELPGVYAATEFLVLANLEHDELPADERTTLERPRRVVVVGGGDTAMDCVRSAIRLGAQSVTCLYRRSEAEMPGRTEERRYAREEGARIEFLAAPVRLLGDGRVQSVECVRMELTEPDASGRRGVRPVPGSEFRLEADTVVVAAGYKVDATVAAAVPGLEARASGPLIVEAATGQTHRPGVFAGGDLVNGPNLVVTAVADGRRAAQAIHAYLSG